MMALIWKDIAYGLKRFIIFLAVSALFPLICYLDNATQLVTLVFIMGPFIAIILFLPQTCYLDDDVRTNFFLKSLPIKKAERIGAKYILGIFSILACISLTVVTSLILGMPVDLGSVLLSVSLLLGYFAIYFFLFFRYNYGAAQKTIMVYMMIVLGILLFAERLGFNIAVSVSVPMLLCVFAICSLLFYILSYLLATKLSS